MPHSPTPTAAAVRQRNADIPFHRSPYRKACKAGLYGHSVQSDPFIILPFLKSATFMKFLFCFLMIFVISRTAAQQRATGDTAYLNVEKQKYPDIQNYQVAGFEFDHPTVDLENMVYIFVPKANRAVQPKAGKRMKKVTTYIQFAGDAERKLHSYELYDREGKKVQTNEFGYINVFFKYRPDGQLSEKIRVVRSDTVAHQRFRYNRLNQLLAYSAVKILYDDAGRPRAFKDSTATDPPYNTVLLYDHNAVRIEEQKNDKAFAFREFTYSENLNLIREHYPDRTVFHSYNAQHQKIKSVEFANGSLLRIQTFAYDDKGDLTLQRSQSGPNLKTSTWTENRPAFKYDKAGNRIYEKNSSSASPSATEYFYEIEYY